MTDNYKTKLLIRLTGWNVVETRYTHYPLCFGRVIMWCLSAVAPFVAVAQKMREIECLAIAVLGRCTGGALKKTARHIPVMTL